MTMMNELAHAVLQKRSLEECSVDELRDIANKYPYAPAIQLLLARKMKDEQAEGWQQQLDRASLYVPNSSWLNYLMSDVPAPVETVAEVIAEPVAETIPVKEMDGGVQTHTINAVENAELAFDEEETALAEEEMDPTPIQLPGLKIEPIDPNTAELSYTPYHTVDYFASQGIRVREEEKPADKFGQQLRSFTEWLKALRDAPLSEAGKQVTAGSEQKVEQLAEHSLSEKEIVTEAMAEVWEKQGEMAKAAAVYEKLSLQNPSKSAYFAGLIKKLKTT